MNDDERFVRAILDAPRDADPRAVYADWLEDRSDPRAAYLRAEQEATKTGDTARMRQQAVGLDTVWVARVTLPPLGVCCEHIEIRERGPLVDAGDINQFERRSEITLPHDYRAFLLNYNGGVAVEYPYETSEGEVITWGLAHEFYSLKPLSRSADKGGLQWWASFRHRFLAQQAEEEPLDPGVEDWFLDFLPVGRSPDAIFILLLGVGEHVFGQVRYFDLSAGFSPGFLDQLRAPHAESFAEFLVTVPSTGYP